MPVPYLPRVPLIRVDHVSIAVREIDRALDFFLEYFPARQDQPKADGYDGQFRWADFKIGEFRIELVESMCPGSFVERFLERRGEGFHHWSLNVDELDPLDERLVRDGIRVVDRFDEGGGAKTLFIHPKSAFGVLIQFWQKPSLVDEIEPSAGGTVAKNGVLWEVDHLSMALEEMKPARDFLARYFDGRVEVEPHSGYDGSFRLMQMLVRDYRMELMENARPGGFLERFLARRGPGLHHISIDVEDLDTVLEPFERRGSRIVDRFELAPGWKTAFLHPHSTFGVLVQFWQTPARNARSAFR